MSALTDAIVANKVNSIPTQEAVAATLAADQGNSGPAYTGITLTGTGYIDCKAELGFIPRMAYISVGGNFTFKTLDGNIHCIPVADKSWIGPIWMPYIGEASLASIPTTATGVHVF